MKKKPTPKDEQNEGIVDAVPESEKWLYDNPAALASVRKGLADAAAGKTVKLGSFREVRRLE